MVLPSATRRAASAGVVLRGSASRVLNVEVVFEIANRFRRADGGGDEGPALGGFPELLHNDLVTARREGVEVGDHFVPIEKLAVERRWVTEVRRRRRDGPGGCGPGEEKKDRGLQQAVILSRPFFFLWRNGGPRIRDLAGRRVDAQTYGALLPGREVPFLE